MIEEAVASGIEEILIVTSSMKRPIEDHFDKSYELEDTLAKKGKTEMLEMVQGISNLAQIHMCAKKEQKDLDQRFFVLRHLLKMSLLLFYLEMMWLLMMRIQQRIN